MKLTRVAGVLAAVLLLAPTLFAAEDLSGKWTGSFVASMNGGAAETESAYMVLKHTGKELTGTAGPSADKQWPILKGTIVAAGASTKASFDVESGEGPSLHFELEFVDGHLKGNASAEQGGMKMNAVLDLTRVK